MSDIVRCTCKHPFQDSLYGVGNRVTTPMRSGQAKCTVCGTVHGSQSVVKIAKVKEPVKEIVKTEKKVESKSDKKSDTKDDKKKSLKGGRR
jgi:hypothetical protein